MTASPVGNCIAKSHAYCTAWFICRQLQTLGLNGKFFAAVFFGKAFGTFRQLITHRLPMEEGEKAFGMLQRAEALKIVLVP